MNIPESVKQYNEAQWWYFTHLGVPIIFALLVVYLIAAIRQWREDCKPYKEGFGNEDMRVTPKLEAEKAKNNRRTRAGSQPPTRKR